MSRARVLCGALLAFIFVFVCLLPYSAVFSGEQAFNSLQLSISRFPLKGWFFLFFVALPYVLYSLMSLMDIFNSSANVFGYSFPGNWVYLFRRLAVLIIIPFAGYHLIALGLKFAFSDGYLTYSYMRVVLGGAWIKAFYTAGILAVSYEMCVGGAVTFFNFGVVTSARSFRVISRVMWVAAIFLAAWGTRLVFSFR